MPTLIILLAVSTLIGSVLIGTASPSYTGRF